MHGATARDNDAGRVGGGALIPHNSSPWRRDALPALAVVCGTLALRLCGVAYGLPNQFHPDEAYILAPALRISWTDLNPHFFEWPANLSIYLCAGVLGVARGTIVVVNWGLGARYSVSESDALLIGRLISVAFGTLTVAAVYLVARSRHGWRLGVAAAALYAVLPYPTLDSRYLSPDTTGTFFAFLAVVGTALGLEAGRLPRRWAFGIGVAAGLGAAVKFTMALSLAPLVGILVARFVRQRRRSHIALVGWAITGACAAFLCACPYALLDARTFLDDIAFQKLHGEGTIVHIGYTSENPARFYLFESLPAMVGWPAATLFVSALVGAVWSGGVFARTLAAFVGLWLAMLELHALAIDRYLLPVAPLLTLLAADLAGRIIKPTLSLVVAGAMLVAAGSGLTQSLWIARAMQAEDTRLAAGRWIDANFRSDNSFAVEAYGPVSAKLARATRIWRNSEHWMSSDIATARPGTQVWADLTGQNVDYVVISSAWYERYFRAGELPDSRAHALTRNAREFYALLETRACLIKEWDPNPASTAFPPVRARSDELTYMGAPVKLATLRSAGPTLRLYLLRKPEQGCP